MYCGMCVRRWNEIRTKPAECLGVELTESGYLEPGTHFQKVWQGLKGSWGQGPSG